VIASGIRLKVDPLPCSRVGQIWSPVRSRSDGIEEPLVERTEDSSGNDRWS
jgi:hypothetical protein